MKGIIYYTDNRVGEPILPICQHYIEASGLPIVSCSLKPITFGEQNIVLEGKERGYLTMIEQIFAALTACSAKYVFFCEHDVLYSKEHFDFTPERDDVYYYNVNNYRWEYKTERVITYDGLLSLSMLCCNRELAVRHYDFRIKHIYGKGYDKLNSREPRWARVMGYEPGTKRRRNGGLTDEPHLTWKSSIPNVDIRHKYTFSPPKVNLDSFKHKPTGWVESTIDNIPGWDIRRLFNR